MVSPGWPSKCRTLFQIVGKLGLKAMEEYLKNRQRPTRSHSFVCLWGYMSLSTPIITSTYWELTLSLFSCFTSINSLTLWGSRSCYFLHSSDEGHRPRDVRSLVWCHKLGGPEWLSFSKLAIIGCDLSCVHRKESKKHSASEVPGRQRQGGHDSRTSLD